MESIFIYYNVKKGKGNFKNEENNSYFKYDGSFMHDDWVQERVREENRNFTN